MNIKAEMLFFPLNKKHCNILHAWREKLILLRYGRKTCLRCVFHSWFTHGMSPDDTKRSGLKWLLQRSPRLAVTLQGLIPPPQALGWDRSIGKLRRDRHEKPKIIKKASRVCSV